MNGKKLTAILFAVLLLVSMCSCTTQGTADPTGTTAATAAAATAAVTPEPTLTDPYAEHMEISWLGYSMKDGYSEDNRTQKYFEDMFNVTFTVPEFLDWRNQEQVSLMVSSGVFPDFVGVLRYANIKDVNDKGLTRDIPIQMVREYAPDLAAMMDESGGSQLRTI